MWSLSATVCHRGTIGQRPTTESRSPGLQDGHGESPPAPEEARRGTREGQAAAEGGLHARSVQTGQDLHRRRGGNRGGVRTDLTSPANATATDPAHRWLMSRQDYFAQWTPQQWAEWHAKKALRRRPDSWRYGGPFSITGEGTEQVSEWYLHDDVIVRLTEWYARARSRSFLHDLQGDAQDGRCP